MDSKGEIYRTSQTSCSNNRQRTSRVCIDGYNLALPKGTGIATYSRNLLVGIEKIGLKPEALFGPLSRLNVDDIVNEANIASNDDSARHVSRQELFTQTWMARWGRNAWPVVPSGKVLWPSNQVPHADRYWIGPSLFRYAKRSFGRSGAATPLSFKSRSDAPRPDVMHWTSPMTIHARGMPNIYTFHDLIPLRLPHATTDQTGTYLRLVNTVLRHADHIAVVSETTKRDLIELLGVPEQKITNTYQSVELPVGLTDLSVEQSKRDIDNAFDLSWKSYFLHFGAIEPKKNLARVIQAYLSSGVSAPLVLVGGRAWMSEEETALLEEIQRNEGSASKRIRQYEYLPFDLLASLIRGAKATLFPSLYEGFGLPVLESMAMGTAVITSTAGSLPEISGGAAILVPPYDVQALAVAIRTVDADEAMALDMSLKGLKQAQKFSSDNYHARLRVLYAKVGLST